MKLENLKDFEWYNEPENVFFRGEEMRVIAAPQTDFWQNSAHDVHIDNGHFFYKKSDQNFTLDVCWNFENADKFSQCGLMLRLDDLNWFKVSLMYNESSAVEVGSCLTVCGNSDWANVSLEGAVHQMWYRLVRKGLDYVAFYSIDGEHFIKLRQFVLKASEIKAGAYLAAPQRADFEAVLNDVNFS